jgi:prepilin-type processing-associated H-X9-DG protein
MCPSDGLVADGDPINLAQYTSDGNPPPANPRQGITSYAGNSGMWRIILGPCIAAGNGNGQPDADFPLEQAAATGVIYAYSCTRLSSITDGTSNTMLFSERPYGLLESDPDFGANATSNDYWWNSGYWGHTTFDTNFQPNALRKYKDLFDAGGWWLAVDAAGSFHPGGVNASMADGSVRFIKDTISCWPIDRATIGAGNQVAPDGRYQNGPAPNPRVWQALSTRRAGEVVSADSY